MMVAIVAVALGLLIFLESVAQGAGMHKGDKFCRMAKYLCTAFFGMALGWAGLLGVVAHLVALPTVQPPPLDWLHIASGCALALFIWPHTYGRFRSGFFDRRRRHAMFITRREHHETQN